jgi:hypothetical protein
MIYTKFFLILSTVTGQHIILEHLNSLINCNNQSFICDELYFFISSICVFNLKINIFSAPFLCKLLCTPLSFFSLFCLHAPKIFLAQRLFERDVPSLKSKLCELTPQCWFSIFLFEICFKNFIQNQQIEG